MARQKRLKGSAKEELGDITFVYRDYQRRVLNVAKFLATIKDRNEFQDLLKRASKTINWVFPSVKRSAIQSDILRLTKRQKSLRKPCVGLEIMGLKI